MRFMLPPDPLHRRESSGITGLQPYRARGEQRIDFRKLPSVCTHPPSSPPAEGWLKTIHHSGDGGVNSMASWDPEKR